MPLSIHDKITLMKLTIKKTAPYWIPLVFLILLHLYYILFNHSSMIFYGDSFEQELMFYMGGWERFHSLNFSLWDWTLGYGANYLSRTFYFVTNPFFWISLALPKNWIPGAMLYFNILKLYLLWIFSYFWLNSIHKHRRAAWLIASMITFSGWTMMFYHYNFFIDAFLLYPLILYFVEHYFKTKQRVGLILSIAYLGFVNFYFLYMFIPFLVLYFLMRLYVLFESSLKDYFKQIFHFLMYIGLALGLVSFILIPNFYIILQAPRLTQITFQDLLTTPTFREVYRYVSTLFTPVMERFDPSYYISTQIDAGIGWGGGTSLYFGYLSLLLFPLALVHPERKIRDSLRLFSFILLFFASFKGFYRLLQGTLDVRWFYMFTLLEAYALMVTLPYLQRFGELKKKLTIIVVLNLSVIVMLIYLNYRYAFNASEVQRNELYTMVLYSLSILLIYYFMVSRRNLKWNIVIAIVLIECTVSFYLPLIHNPPIQDIVLEQYLEPLADDAAVKYIASIDSGFYRILKDNQIYLNQNEPFVQNYKGTSFYASVYNFNLDSYYDRFNETYSIPSTLGREYSYLLTSVKYFITDTHAHTAPYGFELVKELSGVEIYQNQYFIPLGWIQTKSLNLDTFHTLSYLDQDRLLLDYAITNDSSNHNYQFRNTYLSFASNVHIDRYFLDYGQALSNTMVILENKDIAPITVRSSVNGSFTRDDTYSQYFYSVKYFDDQSIVNAIEIYAPNAPESKIGYSIYLDTNLDWIHEWYSEKSPLSLQNIKETNSTLEASIQCLTDQSILVTSIPFDEGWSIKVDNIKTTPINVNDGFIGIQLNKGYHQISFSYWPPYLNLGLLISLISLLTFLYLGKIKLLNRGDKSNHVCKEYSEV